MYVCNVFMYVCMYEKIKLSCLKHYLRFEYLEQ